MCQTSNKFASLQRLPLSSSLFLANLANFEIDEVSCIPSAKEKCNKELVRHDVIGPDETLKGIGKTNLTETVVKSQQSPSKSHILGCKRLAPWHLLQHS